MNKDMSSWSPCPLPILRTSWEEEERQEMGGSWFCSDLSLAIFTAELG